MESGRRPTVKEQIVPPTIAWAKNSYTPSGDIAEHTPGITRVGIGSTIYDLREAQDHSVFLTARHVDVDLSSTRIYIGNLGSTPHTKVIADTERPFALDDSERINAAAKIAKKFTETDISFTASLQIERNGMRFLGELRSIIPQTDRSALEKIGVLGDELEKYIDQDYPSEFLRVADAMEQLGIEEIEYDNGRSQRNNITANFLRKTYGETAKKE